MAKKYSRCGNSECGVSMGICGRLTHGSGKLDEHGYWEIQCYPCARVTEQELPEYGVCWPPPEGEDALNIPGYVDNS